MDIAQRNAGKSRHNPVWNQQLTLNDAHENQIDKSIE